MCSPLLKAVAGRRRLLSPLSVLPTVEVSDLVCVYVCVCVCVVCVCVCVAIWHRSSQGNECDAYMWHPRIVLHSTSDHHTCTDQLPGDWEGGGERKGLIKKTKTGLRQQVQCQCFVPFTTHSSCRTGRIFPRNIVSHTDLSCIAKM